MTKPRLLTLSLAILLVNSAYLIAFPVASTFYIGNVVFHLVLGTVAGIAAITLLGRDRGVIWIVFAAASGVLLAWLGNTRDHYAILGIHVVLSLASAAILFYTKRSFRLAGITGVAAAVLLIAGIALRPEDRIHNARTGALSMQEEGAGPASPFFPSSAKTVHGGLIPSGFFMESEKCGECHRDIYQQWKSSVHHFASFNNQFYRKSIEYMQSVTGTQASRWCAGCHDHAVFFNGRFEKPIKEQIDTPEAQAGLSCMSCHSIVHVAGSVGNGGFTMSYPPLHEVASNTNPYFHAFENFLTYAAPEAHRRTFMKPFMRQDSPEFCASCHKVHLDVPVNNYRWFRGFNEYDAWQASGVSGQGARSFYYPQQSSTCSDCHMPLVASRDPGNHDGKVHSHSFPGANMAVPFVNGDRAQMDLTEKFLKSGFITVDIFAISPVTRNRGETEMVRRTADAPRAMTSFAIGEEAEQTGNAVVRDVGQIAAPVGVSAAALQPGETVRVDVVVRTRKIGHFFPGGTVDSFDVWLELEAEDANSRKIFWSGRVEDNGAGPVEPGAHFYRSYQLDGDGNPINKRNAWQSRSVLYVRLIPPGAADVAHYRVQVPKDAKGPIRFSAKLNYRKFSHYYTQFSYAGMPRAGQDPALLDKEHNGLEYSFDAKNIPANVSGGIKDRIPDIPIVTLAHAEASVPLGTPQWNAVAPKNARERWNDWGIGLLLQGDLKAAEFAFRKVTEADPAYADGWLNVARSLIQEGETEAARPYIEHALKADASLGRIYFFRAMIEKAAGDYDGALHSLERVIAQYPRDRVALNQAARILFLKRDYAHAVEYLQRVCDIDPEDVQMHYTAMLAYRGLGDAEKASREEALFRRFKAEESAQSITARRRMFSPEDNNERQSIHDHESTKLP